MKKIVSFILLALICATASALPFVPTTDPNLPSTNWYYIKTEGHYVVGSNSMAYPSSSLSTSSNYQWCFVGDNNSGYRLYNRQYEKYLGISTYMYPAGYQELAQYKERSDNTFYLYYYDNTFNMHTYMYYDAEQNDLTAFGAVNDVPVGCFEAVLAEEGAILPPTPAWTRYDANGVGYGFIEGGSSDVTSEASSNLVDNNATTKYYGTYSNCWITMMASQSVAVEQYSIVTANDSREYYERAPRSWKLQGSNDCATWQDIDVQIDYPMPISDYYEVVIHVNDTRKFSYFRFETTNAVSTHVQLSEVWINKQNHNWAGPNTDINPTCAQQGKVSWNCIDCGAHKWGNSPATGSHNYINGVCTVCGLKDNEKILLNHGQDVPYSLKAYKGERNGSNGWTYPPAGWTDYNFNDSEWIDVLMPVASRNHTDGPFEKLKFNSYWYGDMNCYFFRRAFNLEKLSANDKFTFRCVHDDNLTVYINGEMVIYKEGWTETNQNCNWDNSYNEFDIPASAFHTGDNMLVAFVQQTAGGAYFDCELRMTTSATAGDVDGDGFHTAGDVTALYNWLLNEDNTAIVNGDQDGDGSITAGDVTVVYNLLLGD